jgi:hypothetical protein
MTLSCIHTKLFARVDSPLFALIIESATARLHDVVLAYQRNAGTDLRGAVGVG